MNLTKCEEMMKKYLLIFSIFFVAYNVSSAQEKISTITLDFSNPKFVEYKLIGNNLEINMPSKSVVVLELEGEKTR
jgi:hypothetical protein